MYAPVMTFDFVYFDDTKLIHHNLHFLNKPANILQFFRHDILYPTDRSAYYRPMLTVSFMAGALFSNTAIPFPHFLINILLHLTASSVLFIFLITMQYKRALALLFSLIFVAHPILTQTVGWLPGRNDSLLTIFILLAFIFFIRYVNTATWKHYTVSMLFYLLALFTKESTLFFLPLAVFYTYGIARIKNAHARLLRPASGWLLLTLIWFAARKAALGASAFPIFKIIKAMVEHAPAILLYVGKIFFPFNLSAMPTLGNTTLMYGVVAMLLVLLFLFFSKEKRYPFLIFGAAWFFVFLLPSFFTDDPSLTPIFYEHRIYLPLIGLFIILMEIDFIKNIKPEKHGVAAAIVLLILVFSFLTIRHSQNFKNRLQFWEHAVKTAPTLPRAFSGLGSVYLEKGIYDKAEEMYLKGIALNPDEQVLHGNLGLVYYYTNRFQEAEQEFKKELSKNPYNSDTYLNLGVLYFLKLGRFEDARDTWEKALTFNPHYLPIHENLAIYYYEIEKDIATAVRHIEEIQRSNGKPQQSLLDILDEYSKSKIQSTNNKTNLNMIFSSIKNKVYI